ncbi:MAG: CDP-alcohol phosphatidyltransferase family protein [Deltaproteobacteria bacterium]|nr:CDP-alcohol phosphatidyltransferase family protein [Deltaproteobacteria bacterium]
MIKEKLGHRIDGVVHTLFPFLFFRPINPDWLSVCGAVVSVGAAAAFARGEFLIAGLVMWAGGFFDLVDGVVARHFGVSTTFGGFLDSTLDRLVDMAILLGIIIHYSGTGHLGFAVLAAYVLVCTVLTSYAKARAELHLSHLPGGMFERGERMGLLIAGAVFGWMEPVLGLLAVGTTYTLGQRLWVAQREMALLDGSSGPNVTEAV